MKGPSIESLWFDISGSGAEETLLEWPPDVFAFTASVLERSQAYRFAVSPPPGRLWPPARRAGWSDTISDAAAQWCAWAEERQGPPPPLVARSWAVVRDSVALTLDDVGSGRAWSVCEALLTLHAASDEACAGMGGTIDPSRTGGYRCRARARELLARTGSVSRLPGHRLRVLPKGRTVAGGISSRSLSRYVCHRGPAVEVVWHRVSVRRPGTAAHQHMNVLLLPWPLRVRQRDFRPAPGSVQRIEDEPFGYFAFQPAEPFNFDLLDRVLASALDEVESVDVVVLPESSVSSGDVEHLEALLARQGIALLVAGVRDEGTSEDLSANWVDLGVHLGDRWWHYRQNKHHRWFLDEGQITQYHLAGALHPLVRWWEAMTVPRRSVQFVELGGGITFVAVVCEDLARLDEVADLLRAVGPTLVVTPLLDGPQLSSRWTARYASVLADDPGSAVLTLTPYGMVERSRPAGMPRSSVVALWKDSTHGLREIALDPGSHGILLNVAVNNCARRRSADGRSPVDNAADLFIAGLHQVRAAEASASTDLGPLAATPARLHTVGLTILGSWAEAVAEAIEASPADVDAVVADALPGAGWRAEFGIEEPAGVLSSALVTLADVIRAASASPAGLTTEEALKSLPGAGGNGDALASLAGKVMRSALESRLAVRRT